MFKTLTFNEMNTFQKVEWLSDMLGESCSMVNWLKTYQQMTDSEKQQVKTVFYDFLNRENVRLTSDVIEEVEKKYPHSPLASLLRQYGYYPAFKPSKITEAAEMLKSCEGEKVTIVKFNDFGFPVVFETVLKGIANKPYAQYNEALWITHKPKRKRNLYRNIILPNENILVYRGWLNIDINKSAYTISNEKGMVVQQSKYGCFDDQYLHDVIEQYGEPFVKLI
jgi:hypothetical protein